MNHSPCIYYNENAQYFLRFPGNRKNKYMVDVSIKRNEHWSSFQRGVRFLVLQKERERARQRERETESKRKGERGNESESTWPSLQPFYIIKICRKDCAAVDSHENACELGCVQD